MQIDEKDKVNILIGLLNERYNASHKMRERSQSFAIWILGIGIAVIGLLLTGQAISISEKWLLIGFVILVWLLSVYYLRSIERGFQNNRSVMINLERVLGCYDKGVYLKSKSLFPPEYANSKDHLSAYEKMKCYLRSHFIPMYAWITVVALMVGLMIWYSPIEKKTEAKAAKQSSTSKQIGSTSTVKN
ncbi:MAG: hypothetical protein QME63_07220 [Actinomycetota bacterium]|nr:hypothetical protein [Actinomycetota bacterium]